MSALPKTLYTLAEYLVLDAESDERLEYFNGEIFSMSGVSEEHAQIETNLIFHLRLALRGRSCRVFPADMRIRVPSLPPYRYGDFSALCGQPVFQQIHGVDTLTNPSLIVEILSPSTAAFDQDEKFTHYKSIESFTEYVLIAQDRPHIKKLLRQEAGAWLETEVNSLDNEIYLSSLDCSLSVCDLYEEVAFPENRIPFNVR